MKLIDEIVETHPEMISWRHRLHMHPETAFEEHETAEFIAGKLAEFGIETRRGFGGTGVVGTVKAGSSPATIVLRAELDALNMEECNRSAHCSSIPGKMHGCGHDGHMTMLLGAARHLARNPNFDGTVHFVFQPGEETGNGALKMIEDGLFDAIAPEAVYAMHNFPGLEAGCFATCSGEFMASLDAFTIMVEGIGGHGGYPSKARSPILPACAIVSALNEHVGTLVPPEERLAMSVAQINAGSALNVIPQSATIAGTVRTLSETAQEAMEAGIERIAQGICAAYGVTCNVDYARTYPVLVNWPEETERATRVAEAVVGPDRVKRHWNPMMASEDFAWMLRERPGNYIAIGNGVGEKGGTFVHHPEYDFNDDILPIGASYWVRLTESLLTANKNSAQS